MNDALLDQLRNAHGRPNPQSILTLWREGYDTHEIAKMLSVGTGEISEAYVANKLIHLRHKQMQAVRNVDR